MVASFPAVVAGRVWSALVCGILLFPVGCLAALPDDIGGGMASSARSFFPLPPLRLPDENGVQIDLREYRGRVVLVNFWATWCPPCIEEFPSMQLLRASFQEEELEILAVNVGEGSDQVFGFTGLLDANIEFPVLYDADMRLTEAWGVRALPTTIVVDRHGRGIYRVTGGRQWDSEKIKRKLLELLR